MTTPIYVFAEHTTRKGEIVLDPERYTDDDGHISDDVFLYGEGTEDELIKRALDRLARPCDRAPHFRHTCDRAVLDYLDGPRVEPHYDKRGMYWLPAEDLD